MPATADTTTIAQALGIARSIARIAAPRLGPRSREQAATLAHESLTTFEEALEALKRIEGREPGRVPLKLNGKLVGEIDAEAARTLYSLTDSAIGFSVGATVSDVEVG